MTTNPIPPLVHGRADIHQAVTRITVSVFPPELWDHIDAESYLIHVEETAPGRWAVCRSKRCLNAAGDWDWEPIPGERTDAWLAELRHDRDTALRLAVAAAPLISVNGMTAVQALAWVRDRARRAW